MVRGFVQQQYIWIRQEQLGEFYPHQPAAAEAPEWTAPSRFVEAETRQDFRNASVTLEAASVVESGAGLVVAFGQFGGDLGGGLPEASDFFLEGMKVGFELVEVSERAGRLFVNGMLQARVDFLAQEGDVHTPRCRDFSAVSGLISCDHAQKSRLSGSIGPHETQAVTGMDLEAQVTK